MYMSGLLGFNYSDRWGIGHTANQYLVRSLDV